MMAILNDLDMIPMHLNKEVAQSAWFMDEDPFSVSIIKNHPFSLRITHYHVDLEKLNNIAKKMADDSLEFEDLKGDVIKKELTTYGDLEKVYRLMYLNEWLSQPESESSIQVTE